MRQNNKIYGINQVCELDEWAMYEELDYCNYEKANKIKQIADKMFRLQTDNIYKQKY
jgi:hypothetical protein